MLQSSGPFRRSSLKSYISQMNTPNPKAVFDDNVAEILAQQGFQWREDPRSIYDPEQLYTALKRYATDWSDYEFVDSHLEFGFRKAFKIFAKPKGSPKLDILTNDEVISKALKLNKSAGLPLMVKKADALTYGFDREEQIRAGVKAPNPCVAYKRTQKGNKTRLVWGYPLEMTIMEARFARPLIDRFKKNRSPMAFGLSKAELGAYIHRYVVDEPGKIIALDYSKFDTTISATMIRQAFRILSTWFTDESLKEMGWKTLVNYFIHTPIVMPDGHLYRVKHHGVPSGSYFTQIIDSIVNVAVCFALSSRFGFVLRERSLFVLGDDVLMNVVSGLQDLEAWGSYLETFGLIINVEKTMVDTPHFLGAVWYKGKPDADIEELVAKAVFPESYRHYGGNPHIGAKHVLRSYAASYLSGVRMLSTDRNIRTTDMPPFSEETLDTRWLSGSDRLLLEESMLGGLLRSRTYLATISHRMLL